MSAITTNFGGNLTDNPVLRYTSQGTAVANLRVAVNGRRPDGNGGFIQTAEFVNVVVWRDMAEHVAFSATKGQRVTVQGVFKEDKYTDDNGIVRYTSKVHAQDIGISLMFDAVDPEAIVSGKALAASAEALSEEPVPA
jgi:single-strand DNA-binding protein